MIRQDWSTLKKLMFMKTAAAVPAVEDTATGNPVVFVTDLAKPLKQLKVNFTPKQASGTPSPDTVLPITGWTGLDVWRTGTNVWNEQTEKGQISTTTGLDDDNDNQIRTKGYVSVVGGAEYCFVLGSTNGVWVLFYDRTTTQPTDT